MPAGARTAVFQVYKGDPHVVHAHHLLSALSPSMTLADFLILQSHMPSYPIYHPCRFQRGAVPKIILIIP
jgi:hypothetical protein